jgi:hypothetical protein
VTQKETILLFGLSDAETQLTRRLVSSFDVEVTSLSVRTLRNYVRTNPDKKICLILYHIDKTHPRPERVIRLINDLAGSLVPFLVLVPREKHSDIKKYIEAGADDFIELPLNENRYSVSFLILFEMGQVVSRPFSEKPVQRISPDSQKPAFGKLVNYFQQGLSYFAPKSLRQNFLEENISDRWEKVKRLGMGGFGVVWLVREIGGKRLAVAKAPHSTAMNIRVLRSAAILKRLVHHPNIVHLLEIVKDSGKLILIQEYVEGPTLQQLLAYPMSGSDKESYFLQLVAVISYAHKHKILHRDIKPENILINKNGQLKLLDFGIAKDLTWQSSLGRSEGTIDFMPPEQFEGKSCIASDVWALGVILYILATGSKPYSLHNDQYPQDIDATLAGKAPHLIVPGIAPELETIIMRCLQKDLDKRYPDATALQKDLHRYFPQFGMGKTLPDKL